MCIYLYRKYIGKYYDLCILFKKLQNKLTRYLLITLLIKLVNKI